MLRSTKECTVAAPDCACRAFRSHAVQVTESAPERWTLGVFQGEAFCEGGFGGKQVESVVTWDLDSVTFFGVFLCGSTLHCE